VIKSKSALYKAFVDYWRPKNESNSVLTFELAAISRKSKQ